MALLNKDSLYGFIGPRALLFLQSTEGARKSSLIEDAQVEFAADLGLRVMDDAWIEACAMVVRSNAKDIQTLFIRLLDEIDKELILKQTLCAISLGEHSAKIRLVYVHTFLNYPNNAISYWLPASYLRFFEKNQTFEQNYGTIRQGLATADDFRYLRLFPEVLTQTIGATYYPFAKGGEYSPFYGIPELLVYWTNNGQCYWDEKSLTTGLPRSNIWMLKDTISNYFFQQGLTYTQRTNSAFAPRVLPEGCIFATKGESIFCERASDLLFVLAMMNSKPFQILIEAFVSTGDSVQSEGQARSYLSGTTKKFPLPLIEPNDPIYSEVVESISQIVHIWKQRSMNDQTSQLFSSIWLVSYDVTKHTLHEPAILESQYERSMDGKILELSWNIERRGREIFGLDCEDISFIHHSLGPHVEEYEEGVVPSGMSSLYMRKEEEVLAWLKTQGISGRQFVNQSHHSSRKVEILSHLCKIKGSSVAKQLSDSDFEESGSVIQTSSSLIDFVVGSIFGRWDIRYLIGERQSRQSLELPDPFAPLPICPPGMLQGEDGLPLNENPEGYPLLIEWDGILVDDSDHQDDIIRRIRDLLELIWKDRADAIEKEAYEILGVKNLRDYFRKPGNGGFWDDHIKRYSKSRRKAPIYWLLQSPKKNYALWLYYHRLDKDMLFKALLHYVEPKIRLEESRLDTLRSQQAEAGTSGSVAKKLAKDIDRQEELLSELRDFEDKLRRVANLHLDPDLNDGVVLNIAPLRELVPWKEAKTYWDELLAGKYEWSSIGKQLRERSLVHGH